MKKTSLFLFIWMTVLTGIIYQLCITLIAQLTMPKKANGSLLLVDDKTIGSTLLAQKFETDRYFWPRPSAVDYNPLPSGGSNLGPTSATLKELVRAREDKLKNSHRSAQSVPSELLFASGSGLDPHISPITAIYQVERNVKARKLDETGKQKIMELIANMTTARQFGFLGTSYVNVLELNHALDQIKATP